MIQINYNLCRALSQNLKCIKACNLTSLPIPPLIRRFHNSSVYFIKRDDKEEVIDNICKKFHCTYLKANDIYDSYTALRRITAMQNDTMDTLRSKISDDSIIENPLLITMDTGKDPIATFDNFFQVIINFQFVFRNNNAENPPSGNVGTKYT